MASKVSLQFKFTFVNILQTALIIMVCLYYRNMYEQFQTTKLTKSKHIENVEINHICTIIYCSDLTAYFLLLIILIINMLWIITSVTKSVCVVCYYDVILRPKIYLCKTANEE